MFLFSLTNVTKRFKTNKTFFTAVENVSLNLPSSGLVSIVGKSGCGKSTLLNMLIGIEKPTSGTIMFEGKKMSRFSKRKLSDYRLKDISMVYQHYNLISDLSVIENIALPLMIGGKSKRNAFKRANTLLNQFNLAHLLNQNVNTLSGGEKQRVAILRAIITNPKAILCDEPTGALDEKNSILIMDELKRISRNKLVIIVSHNQQLVEKYSNRIIQMKEGKIVKDATLSTNKHTDLLNKSTSGYKNRWITLLLKPLFKRNIFKMLFSLISLTVGFVSIFVGFGFIEGSQTSQDQALKRNLEIGYATVSETTYYSVANSPLQFKRNVRPDSTLIDEYLNDVNDIVICPNTNYFFSPFPNGYFHDEQIDNFEMVPLLDEFIIKNGVYPRIAGDFLSNSLTNVLVNSDFLRLINRSKSDAINEQILISYETSITLYTNDDEKPFVKDTFSYKLKLTIIDVIDEFSFMNSPKIYYSYNALESMLKNEFLQNISHYREKDVSIYDYINESKPDSPESSYSSFIFLNSLDDCEKFFSIVKQTTDNDERLQIESKVYTISDSYKTFISSFKDALFFFLIIGSVGVLFILGMVSLSNFLENKKQSAILTCLGAKTSSISRIYLFYNLVISFIGFAFGLLISLLMESSMNSLIEYKFGLTNLITIPTGSFLGIKFGFILMIFIISVVSTILFTILPILVYKNFSISDELRDE